MSSAKKPKVDAPQQQQQQQLDFDAVRAYLLACPAVPANHPAIAAALGGLEKEQKRLARDWKLQQRFMQDAVTVERPLTSLVSGGAEEHKKEAAAPKKEDEDDDEVMSDDWQDIADKASPTAATEVEEANFLGSKVSREAISLMAEYQMQVNSPLAALALALHAGMCTLGFACTGIPEESSAVTGFAKPIRELPKSQLVPAGWDKNPEKVLLRYRKNGVGSIILQVVLQKDPPHAAAAEATLQVTLYPTSAPEPRETMEFAMAEHLNLESWARAVRQQSFVSPTLHYKSLASLLSKFCTTFDLGHVADDNDNERNAAQKLPYVDTTIAQYPPARSAAFTNHNQKQQQSGPAGFAEPIRGGLGLHPPMPAGVPNTIDGAFPDARFRGDFADDLAPGGLTGPHFGRAGNGSGMLMGPHHPAFAGGPGMGLPGGMQPRFDPFGPPGGPTDVFDPNHPMTRRGGPGSGNPNHDHMRPPNNLGNNMFM